MAYSPAPTSARQLSAGIELEGLLIVTRDRLLEVLPARKRIRTTGLTDDGGELVLGIFPSGWAVEVRDENGKFKHFNNFTDNEPQKLAMVLLDGAVYGGDGSHSKRVDNRQMQRTDQTQQQSVDAGRVDSGSLSGDEQYRKEEAFLTEDGWIVKRDLSIRPLTREEKVARSLDPDLWETFDIEFVSKVYACGTGHDGILRMEQDVEALVRRLCTPTSFVHHTTTCGMHVHVGYTDDTRFPIQALQILAFIVLIYEHQISRLFEPHRAGQDGSSSYIMRNTTRCDATYEHFNDREYKHDERGRIYMRSKFNRVDALRAQYLYDRTDGDAAYEALKYELSPTKRYVVNFRNVDGKITKSTQTRPCTVEFRQPEATFDPEAVGHIVRFYTNLVKYCLYLAEHGGEVLPHISRWDDRIDLVNLLAVLDLPQGTLEYLTARLDHNHDDTEELYWEECDEYGRRHDDRRLMFYEGDFANEKQGTDLGSEGVAMSRETDVTYMGLT